MFLGQCPGDFEISEVSRLGYEACMCATWNRKVQGAVNLFAFGIVDE